MNLAEAKRVHFVGIGGAGMSAVAKVLLERGCAISGSDLKMSRAAAMLEAMGACVSVGHRAGNVDGVDAVVVSTAIPENNPERVRAAELGLPVVSRGEALASVLADRRSIVIAGTHGKTTTTSMVVAVLRSAGLDPTYLVGGELNDSGTNARYGRGELAVAESDESDGSFLLLAPHIAIVTNVEADHLDYWGSFEAVREGFASFVGSVAPGGSAIVPSADERLAEAARRAGARTVTFDPVGPPEGASSSGGLSGDPSTAGSEGAGGPRAADDGGGHVRATDVSLDVSGASFTLGSDRGEARVELSVPGAHNVANALAAAAGCLEAGVPLDAVARGLGEFHGVERRFQLRGRRGDVTVIDDYAHHPTEVRAAIAAGHPSARSRMVAVFQPHRYSRTAAFAGEFGSSFDLADRIVVTDVYGAGETPVPGVSGKLVADAVCARLPGRHVAYLPHRGELVDYLVGTVRPGDLVLTLGAGDVTTVGPLLLDRLEERA